MLQGLHQEFMKRDSRSIKQRDRTFAGRGSRLRIPDVAVPSIPLDPIHITEPRLEIEPINATVANYQANLPTFRVVRRTANT